MATGFDNNLKIGFYDENLLHIDNHWHEGRKKVCGKSSDQCMTPELKYNLIWLTYASTKIVSQLIKKRELVRISRASTKQLRRLTKNGYVD